MWLFILSVSDISFIPILSPTLGENKEISVQSLSYNVAVWLERSLLMHFSFDTVSRISWIARRFQCIFIKCRNKCLIKILVTLFNEDQCIAVAFQNDSYQVQVVFFLISKARVLCLHFYIFGRNRKWFYHLLSDDILSSYSNNFPWLLQLVPGDCRSCVCT